MTDFDRYIIQGEPEKSEKAKIWQTAIGLRDVDGLKPSEYLIRTAGLSRSESMVRKEYGQSVMLGVS